MMEGRLATAVLSVLLSMAGYVVKMHLVSAPAHSRVVMASLPSLRNAMTEEWLTVTAAAQLARLNKAGPVDSHLRKGQSVRRSAVIFS